MNWIKKHKILLIVIASAASALLLIFKPAKKLEFQTAVIPTDLTEFKETTPAPWLDKLPYDGESFFIDYPEFDIYTVFIKNANFEKTKQAAFQWFINQGANLKELKIRFITDDDERLIEQLIAKLPLETPEFNIWVSAKTNTFVVTVKGVSFEQNKIKALDWFNREGLTDLTKINLIWQDQTGSPSP